jgi:hypothetical protein
MKQTDNASLSSECSKSTKERIEPYRIMIEDQAASPGEKEQESAFLVISTTKKG